MESLEKIYKIWMSNCEGNIYKMRFTKNALVAGVAWILFVVLSLIALFFSLYGAIVYVSFACLFVMLTGLIKAIINYRKVSPKDRNWMFKGYP